MEPFIGLSSDTVKPPDSTPPPGREAVASQRRTEREAVQKQRTSVEISDNNLSRLRGVFFLAMLVTGGWGLVTREPTAGWLAALSGLFFGVFVYRHARVSTRLFDLDRKLLLIDRSIARIFDRYRADPKEQDRLGEPFIDPEHPYSGDLDLFGPGSLFEQLDTTETQGGRALLARWLKAPASEDELTRRQQAVRALAKAPGFRDALLLAARRCRGNEGDADILRSWALDKPVVERRHTPWLVLAGLLVVATTVNMVLASVLGAPFSRLWLGLVVAQGVVLFFVQGSLEASIAPPSQRASPVQRYRLMVEQIEEGLTQHDGLEDQGQLKAIAATLGSAQSTASQALARLDSAAGFAAVRHSGLGHFLLNVGFLWNVWAAVRLDAWRRHHGNSLGAWLDALSECEALCALASFAAEHPDFAWPTWQEETGFVATGVGHPLLSCSERVTNDVRLDATTRALMITGSNMSGKSTMLRSVGLAAVLAHAGAPVCATSLSLCHLRLWTSMRVDDSIRRGASRFFAEVEKLKKVVDAADEAAHAPVLFLLDEVLHGTNSRERNIGAKAVVNHLVGRGAIGAVSSHDLGLTALQQDTDAKVLNTHFEDHIEDGVMCFDYQMKQGPVDTSNALRLMRAVGMNIEGLQEDESRSEEQL